MRVYADGKTYLIEFAYDLVSRNGNPARESTSCLIRDASSPSPGDGSFPVVTQEQVVRYFRDHADRERARKLALAKALKHLDLAIEPSRFNVDTSIFTELELNDTYQLAAADRKIRRRLFWEAYLGRKRTSRIEVSR